MTKSPVHIKEIGSIANDYERIELLNLLENYSIIYKYNSQKQRIRAEELISKNFGIADAAHIAFAECFESDFISCDDKLLKICKRSDIRINCLNSILFCEMENLR